jgi:mono/diheme cytochrome c family protein
MPHASTPRKLSAALPALALAALLAGGCKPPGEYGYDRVSYRDQPEVPQAAFPDPPAPNAALIAAPQAKLVAKNLPAGVTQAMVDAGQTHFASPCAGCHGPGGTGSAAAPPLNDDKWLNIGGAYPEIVAIITSGVPNPKEHPGPMPPRGGGSFTDAQVRELAAYVFALSHGGGES